MSVPSQAVQTAWEQACPEGAARTFTRVSRAGPGLLRQPTLPSETGLGAAANSFPHVGKSPNTACARTDTSRRPQAHPRTRTLRSVPACRSGTSTQTRPKPRRVRIPAAFRHKSSGGKGTASPLPPLPALLPTGVTRCQNQSQRCLPVEPSAALRTSSPCFACRPA